MESCSLWAFLLSMPEPCAALCWAEMVESLGIWGILQPYEGKMNVVHMSAMLRLLVFVAWLCYLLLTKNYSCGDFSKTPLSFLLLNVNLPLLLPDFLCQYSSSISSFPCPHDSHHDSLKSESAPTCASAPTLLFFTGYSRNSFSPYISGKMKSWSWSLGHSQIQSDCLGKYFPCCITVLSFLVLVLTGLTMNQFLWTQRV